MKRNLGALTISIALALGAAPGAAFADRIVTYSHLGEPLSALAQIEPEALMGGGISAGLIVWMGSEEDYRAAGERRPEWADRATLILKDLGSGRYGVQITTAEPVSEAAAVLILRIGPSTDPQRAQLREYPLMLDPIEGASEKPAEQPGAKADQKPGAKADQKPEAKADQKPEAGADQKPEAKAAPEQIRVSSGDTLQGIARRHPMEGVSAESLIVAYARANPKAFREGNPNEMRAGSVLKAPSRELAESISREEARKELARAARQWKGWREKAAAGASAPERAGEAGSEISGSVEAKPAEGPKEDSFRLGQGADGDRVAMRKALKEAQERVAELEKIQRDLKALVTAQNDQLAKLSERKKELEGESQAARDALAQAMGQGKSAKPLPPLPAGEAKPEAKPEGEAKPADFSSSTGFEEEGKDQEAKPAPKPAKKPVKKPAKKATPPAPPPEPEKTLLETILEKIFWPWSGVGLAMLVAGAVAWRSFGGQKPKVGETTEATTTMGRRGGFSLGKILGRRGRSRKTTTTGSGGKTAGGMVIGEIPELPEDSRFKYTDMIDAADTFMAFGKDEAALGEVEEALKMDPRGKEALIRALRLTARLAQRAERRGNGLEDYKTAFLDRMNELREAIMAGGDSVTNDPMWEEALMLQEQAFHTRPPEEEKKNDLGGDAGYVSAFAGAGSLEEALNIREAAEPAGVTFGGELPSDFGSDLESALGQAFGEPQRDEKAPEPAPASPEPVAAEDAGLMEFSLEGWGSGEAEELDAEEESPAPEPQAEPAAEWEKDFSLEGLLAAEKEDKAAVLRSQQDEQAAAAALELPQSWEAAAPMLPDLESALTLGDLEPKVSEPKASSSDLAREEMSLRPMLELADAYLDLGDRDGAKKMLEEVAASSRGDLGSLARAKLFEHFGVG